MRYILFTGKGGVGKTSVAAATGFRCAELGFKTLVMSTDAAHSLADSFNRKVGYKQTYLCKNLYGQEIDVNEEIKKNWGPIQGFLQQFLKYKGFDNVIAEELAIFPGMEEVFSLLQLKDYYVEGRYDVVIVDCAPTGDNLRLLAAPDIARWYMEKIFNIERTVFKAVRPVAKHFVEMPLPSDDVFQSMEGLYKNLIGMKEVLIDKKISTIRVVLNPEKMVIKESQRAYTFLNLFGYSIDGVVVNRILPEEIKDPYYKKWMEIQKEHLKEIKESFQPLPIFTSKLFNQEVIGMKLLAKMATDIYDEKDPTMIYYDENPIEIEKTEDGYYLFLNLPFVTKEYLKMWVKEGELVIKFKNYKRNVLLPRALAHLKLKGANLEGKLLRIKFGGDKNE
ncbi:MAG: TRC40/GET3/ArsA family transport-energizing ATPase [Thermodesulfobacteriota bacterium]|nr:TRC40/GET3/ArsA family transport-energizing ATPase [Thermodesulfobacteriota bacterium]